MCVYTHTYVYIFVCIPMYFMNSWIQTLLMSYNLLQLLYLLIFKYMGVYSFWPLSPFEIKLASLFSDMMNYIPCSYIFCI